MIDFHSVLARAVAEINGGDVTSRRAVYERAQAALMGELARSNPPPTALQIDCEHRALNDAIRTIEAEVAVALHRDGVTKSRDGLLKVLTRVSAETVPAATSSPGVSRDVSALVGLLPT